MSLKDRLDQDLKTSLLQGDKLRTSTLRILKSAILYAEVAQGSRDRGLDDQAVLNVLTKEAKKRQESADLYIKGGDEDRAKKELDEKLIIEAYLPKALSENQISQLVDEAMAEVDVKDPRAMGSIIALVKAKSQGAADGALVARLVKERLGK
jgi:hypothetical protein